MQLHINPKKQKYSYQESLKTKIQVQRKPENQKYSQGH